MKRHRPGDRTQTGPPAGTYSFCETVHATPTSPEHIRLVGPEGLKFGGGVPGDALCGRDLAKGWDLQEVVTDDRVEQLSTPRPGDGRVFLCRGCTDAYRAAH